MYCKSSSHFFYFKRLYEEVYFTLNECHTKQLQIEISKTSHKMFHFKNLLIFWWVAALLDTWLCDAWQCLTCFTLDRVVMVMSSNTRTIKIYLTILSLEKEYLSQRATMLLNSFNRLLKIEYSWSIRVIDQT